MRELRIYLDSSTVVKRYVEEPGSNTVKQVYRRAYTGEVKLAFSLWNVGEILGALDRARSKGRLSEEDYIEARRRYFLETKKMMKLKLLAIVPLKAKILFESWRIIEKYHIYQADALQIITAKHISCSEFITGDEKLHEIALNEGLNSKYLG